MIRSVVVLLVAAMVATPVVQAQWISDPKGDTEEFIGPADAAHGRSGASDIHSVDVRETKTEVQFTLLHAPPPGPRDSILDAVEYQLTFLHGDAPYGARITYGFPLAADSGYYGELYDESGYLRDLDIAAVEGGFTVTLDKTWIRDQNGATPAKGSAIREFSAYAESQNDLSICIGECIRVGVGSRDVAPNDGTASYDFEFGLAQDGDIRLHSPAPMRWSNGEATVFVFDVGISNHGADDDRIRFKASGIPDGWIVATLPPVDLQAGETRAIPVAIKVPFGHKHGEDETLLIEATGQGGVGRINLGVHYSEVPQPTGHHSEVFLHSREVPVFFLEPVLINALGGNSGTQAFMNTVEDFDGDQNILVPGTKGVPVLYGLPGEEEESFVVGMEYEWAIPLSPSLRVGLKTLADQAMDGTVQLAFDVPAGDVQVRGRFAVVDDTYVDDSVGIDNEQGTELATIPLTEAHAIANKVSVPVVVEAAAQTLPFAPDQQLVLFLTAEVLRPDAPISPNTGVYLEGGQLVLPLGEHHDTLPVNVTFPTQVQQDAIQSLDEPSQETDAQGAPAPGAIGMLAALALAVAGRSRRP